jgi:hypothetical protein
MVVVSVESIDYRIFGDGTAIVQSCNDFSPILLPRNCVTLNGWRVYVPHLGIAVSANVFNASLIPYSLHSISLFPANWTSNLKYLVFEFGSQLESILNLSFVSSKLRSLFLSSTVHFIGGGAHNYCFILDVNLP